MESERFCFGDSDLTDLLRVNPVRSFGPRSEDVTVQVGGAAGEVFVRTELRPLEIPVSVRLRTQRADHASVADVRRRISAALLTDAPARLVLPDDPHRWYMAKLTDPGELDTLWHTGGATLTFTAYDPIAYGRERTQALRKGPNRVFVEGTWETRPVFHLRATGDGAVRVSLRETGEWVEVTQRPAADAVVTIDMGDRRATMSSATAPVDLGSDFFGLPPGASVVDVTGANGELRWTERWI